MYFDLTQPIQFVISILKCLGLWRLDNKWEPLYRAYSYLLHFVFTFLITASMWGSVITAKELGQFSEALYMALTEAALFGKVLNILKLNTIAVNFFKLIKNIHAGIETSNEISIFEKPHRVFHFVAKTYLYASICFVVGSFTVVAIGKNWILPYPAWMPFELHSKYYWYAYGYQFIGMIVTCIANVTIDCIQCYFMHHISLIYQVIGFRLSNIGCNSNNLDDSDNVNQVILKDVRKLMKLHLYVRSITTNCERFISFPIFIQILLSVLVLCFTGYQLTSLSPLKNPGTFFGMVDFLFVMGLQIFLPCYYAHQVTLQSNTLSEAVYNSNWVALPLKSKKVLYMFMVFLKEPVQLKSGHFFNIGLPIFSKVMNNAYSCFAVLIRMKN